MPVEPRKYTDEQRDALTAASLDRGIAPMQRIVDLAAAGELRPMGSDKALPAFAVPIASLRSFIRRERARREGRAVSELVTAKPLDALDMLRQRLVSLADTESVKLARQAERGELDTARAIRCAKLVREIAALTGNPESRPPRPGQGPAGERAGGEIRSGPGADILADFRGTPPQQTATPPLTGDGNGGATRSPGGENATHNASHDGNTQRVHTTTESQGDEEDTRPGVLVRERIAALGLDAGDG